MKNWRVELTAGGKSLAEVKIQRVIFHGDILSPLLFAMAIMLLTHNIRKCINVYKLHKWQERNNHFIYMDDIKQFVENKTKWKP